jgi:magnesium-transporting ATPase (P-type)
LAWKEIREDEYAQWAKLYHEASTSLENRAEKVSQVYEMIERNLLFAGATAIEDKLQDGVPECIAKLSKANIKIWVLTGDKLETAINIGYSCQLLTNDMDVYTIEANNEQDLIKQLKEKRRLVEENLYRVPKQEVKFVQQQHQISFLLNNSNTASPPLSNHLSPYSQTNNSAYSRPDSSGIFSTYSNDRNNNNIQSISFKPKDIDSPEKKQQILTTIVESNQNGAALVINGQSLVYALNDKCEKEFLDLACMCKAVICCRVTPGQKKAVVDLVKTHKKAITLAVGDGANDVSMIKCNFLLNLFLN